jgi:hypothetical protein
MQDPRHIRARRVLTEVAKAQQLFELLDDALLAEAYEILEGVYRLTGVLEPFPPAAGPPAPPATEDPRLRLRPCWAFEGLLSGRAAGVLGRSGVATLGALLETDPLAFEHKTDKCGKGVMSELYEAFRALGYDWRRGRRLEAETER